jgi:hypothetical protein
MTNNANDCRTSDTIMLDCKGPNKACAKAHAKGHPVHIIPAFNESPRVVLADYHFASEEDARSAIADLRENGRIVTCDADLYHLREQGSGYLLPEGWVDPSRR